jgi:general secretion pathway protein I
MRTDRRAVSLDTKICGATGAARRRERGLTLLEVLIAFAIAALALGVMFEGALGGLRASHVAADYQVATALARSHLAALGNGTGMTAREQEGDEGDGFHYQIKISPAASARLARSELETAQGTPPLVAQLFAVTVIVSWKKDGARREVRLDTQRLAAVAAASNGP